MVFPWHFDFDYYLVDECTSVGDKQFKDKAKKKLLEEKKKKSAIIMVTHSVNEVKESCDVALYIDNGQVEYFEDVNEAIKLIRNE